MTTTLPVLSREYIRKATEFIHSNPHQTAPVLDQIFANGLLYLGDYGTNRLVERVLLHGGASSASLLVQHLDSFKPAHDNDYTQRDLIVGILKYKNDTETIERLFHWFPQLLQHKDTIKLLPVSSATEIKLHKKLLEIILTLPVYTESQIDDYVFSLCVCSNNALPDLLDELTSLFSRLNLKKVVEYFCERQLLLDVFRTRIPALVFCKDSTRFSDILLRTFPDQYVSIVLSYLETPFAESYQVKEMLQECPKKHLNQDNWDVFVRTMEQRNIFEYLPEKAVLGLFQNPNLSIDQIINSEKSFKLYRSVVNYLQYIIDQFINANQKVLVMGILNRVIADPNYLQIEDKEKLVVIRILSKVDPTQEVHNTKLLLLTKQVFIDGVYGEDLIAHFDRFYTSSTIAEQLLENLFSLPVFPYRDCNFLVSLFASVDSSLFSLQLLTKLSHYFSYEYQLEDMFLLLAKKQIHNFAFLYTKHNKQLSKSFSKYSTKAKEIRKICWRQLGFLDRFKCLLPW